MQPGDNFAIAASLDPSQVSAGVINVSGIELLNGSGQNIPTTCDETAPVCRSQMLTVWRRLHIEVDSMGAAQGNFVAGATSANARIKPYQAVPIYGIANPKLKI